MQLSTYFPKAKFSTFLQSEQYQIENRNPSMIISKMTTQDSFNIRKINKLILKLNDACIHSSGFNLQPFTLTSKKCMQINSLASILTS